MLLMFAAFGGIVGIHVGSLPVLVQQSGVTPSEFGLAGSLGMVTNIICMGAGGLINRIAGHRTVLLVMIPVAAAALLYALLVTTVAAFMISFLALSAALGTIDLFMNAEASMVEQERKRASFSTYHGSVMLTIAAFALLGSVVSVTLQPWVGVLFAAVPLALAWLAIYRHVEHRAPMRVAVVQVSAPTPRILLVLIGLAAGLNVSCEVAAIQWSGQLLAATAPELAAFSGLGIAFYGLCGGTMRMLADALRTRFGDLRVMAVSLFVAILGFAGLGLTPGFWPSVIAFAAVGCGIAVIFPCLFSLIGRLVPENRARAMSFASLVGGMPRIILPWVLGIIAAQQSVNAVFGACALVALAALTLIVFTYARTGERLTTA